MVGRNKDLIISGGYNVYPKEVELEIDKIQTVNESAVIGVPHDDFGEGVVAIVVKKNVEQDVSQEEIIAHLKSQLANYKIPKKIFFVDQLPRNAMAKVQKNILRDTHAHCFT